MLNKERIRQAMKQMKWELEICGKPVDRCVSCQDAEALIELAHQYLDGKLVEVKL